MLRIQTSFQDTPGDGYYFVLLYNERPLVEQVKRLGCETATRSFCGSQTVGTSQLRRFSFLTSNTP
jgi:hypothetical protein